MHALNSFMASGGVFIVAIFAVVMLWMGRRQRRNKK